MPATPVWLVDTSDYLLPGRVRGWLTDLPAAVEAMTWADFIAQPPPRLAVILLTLRESAEDLVPAVARIASAESSPLVVGQPAPADRLLLEESGALLIIGLTWPAARWRELFRTLLTEQQRRTLAATGTTG